MTEERITEVETPSGNTHTHTTVVTDGEPRSGGGASWGLVIVLLVLGAIAVFAFMQMSGSEAAKDNAVADAASDVGNAAGQVGEAAQDAAENLTN
ncbi:hypothetical protein GRI62_06955 [Erythrobacter arachoides]|uniref:Uncharacterized protein n=1 Tax=Aurantiacibacter arachoides TaxID=1850444 RepID=A0A845A0V0_9SPHN|nr:hypothetical protein [Aurantiacibacter arachoides]MXO93344.1 hypothetical protein [Aurantiacibacter arachoides]GGD50121.1 hypothetical protein GCM10011411_07380 [Aurantiacibacter arachoides]